MWTWVEVRGQLWGIGSLLFVGPIDQTQAWGLSSTYLYGLSCLSSLSMNSLRTDSFPPVHLISALVYKAFLWIKYCHISTSAAKFKIHILSQWSVCLFKGQVRGLKWLKHLATFILVPVGADVVQCLHSAIHADGLFTIAWQSLWADLCGPDRWKQEKNMQVEHIRALSWEGKEKNCFFAELK